LLALTALLLVSSPGQSGEAGTKGAPSPRGPPRPEQAPRRRRAAWRAVAPPYAGHARPVIAGSILLRQKQPRPPIPGRTRPDTPLKVRPMRDLVPAFRRADRKTAMRSRTCSTSVTCQAAN